ncbi:hypothetical protein GPECTOR_1317g559 [Gonium pectorale]|uniref:Uncharacterized protein n=1 Tax=Gonium pectorale TaxID=33097 RepID=A0A150FTG6_GONPE|nr:hypothetical protein GPECTOR_1317g559 [Gonium pectorale]|eukprot:KXZ40917.1 hypothetical protein GPECTOR_1317g559 [Gonium pectorale]
MAKEPANQAYLDAVWPAAADLEDPRDLRVLISYGHPIASGYDGGGCRRKDWWTLPGLDSWAVKPTYGVCSGVHNRRVRRYALLRKDCAKQKAYGPMVWVILPAKAA